MDVKPLNPQEAEMSFGEMTGRAQATQAGEQYQNLETAQPPVFAPPAQGRSQGAPPTPPAAPKNGKPGVEVSGVGFVDMGPPPVATPLLVARILGPQQSMNSLAVAYVKACMYVRAIAGQPTKHPTTELEAQQIMNVLGDVGIDLVMSEYIERWGGVKPADLPLSDK